MDTTELRNVFRSEFFDKETPYLVSDLLVYTYLDEAQKMFCRLTEGVEDARKFTLEVKAAVEWYTISKSILKIRRASDAATGRPIPLVANEAIDQLDIRFDGRVGPLKAFVTGAEKGKVRAWPVPAQDQIVPLEVFRLPRDLGEGDTPEIDEQHHLALLLWVKHKAYGIHDAETYDRAKSEDYEFRFRKYCAAARAEQGRARHDAGSVAYGGC